MIRGLVLCCLVAVALAASDNCDYKGNTYKEGKIFKDGCKICYCGRNGMVGCSKMMCNSRPDGLISTLNANDICNYKGKTYKKGEAFHDACNRCFCGANGIIGCTVMLCKLRPDGELSTVEADKETCDYKGKVYKKGDRFMDDCNRCFCGGNDMVGCTKMGCRPHHVGKPETLTGNEDTCDYKGNTYKKGEAFKDDCNRCFCGGNDMVGCTRMMCRPHHGGAITTLKGDADSCDYKGKMYKKGDRFMDDCNRCFCGGNDMVGCTRMWCKPRHGGKMEFLEGNEDTCDYKGNTYKKGEAFKDDCNRCFCGGNDMVGCTRMLCRPRHDEEITPMKGDADSCDYKGKMYKKGDRFMDDCNRCFCGGNDMVGCTRMMCRPHHGGAITTLKGDADSCDYKGKMYKKGDRFMDDCNRCFCGGNDMVGCTRMLCKPRHGGKMEFLEETGDTSEGCSFKGKVYKKGASFKDDCNICFCGGNGNIGCTIMMCPSKEHETMDTSEGCSFKGKVYKKGASFKDDCNTCFCGGDGNIGCTLMMCPFTERETVDTSESCTFKGKVYKKGASFKDDCNTCFCGGDDVIGCTLMICPSTEHATDYEITTCTHKGKTYNLGDHFKDDCNRCFCGANGNVGCTRMMCIHPNDHNGDVKVTCEHEGKTYNVGERFMAECNKCVCGSKGIAACTQMACVHSNPAPAYSNSETCKQNGKVYKKGDHFPSDDGCNMCFCGGDNLIGCTRMACVKRKGCLHNGKFFEVGAHYKNKCNRCICTKSGGACTKKLCH